MDPRGCLRGLGTSLRHTSYFKPPITQLGRALGHLQTGMGKGFALAVTARTDIYRVLASAVLWQRVPRLLGPHSSEVSCDCVISAARRLGLPVEAPHGVLDTSAPTSELCRARGRQLHVSCRPSPTEVPNSPPCQQPEAKSPPELYKASGSQPLPTTDKHPWLRPRGRGLHPRSQGSSGPADHEQLCSVEIHPRKVLQLSATSLIKTGL